MAIEGSRAAHLESLDARQSAPSHQYRHHHWGQALPFVRRDVGIMLAVSEGQYSLTSIANALELLTSRVSRIVRAQDKAIDKV